MMIPNKNTNLFSISLFTGAGGLDLGIESAGFNVALCVENDALCRKTLKNNRGNWLLSEPTDVHELRPEEALQQAGIGVGELALLAGGPPCQPFSKSSYWFRGDTQRLSDPRASTIGAYLKFIEVIQPKVLLLENVKGLLYNGKDEGLRFLRDQLQKINKTKGTCYELSVAVLNCADFGVPQSRERVFLIAERSGLPFDAPKPTHFSADQAKAIGAERHRTAWDALWDLDSDEWPKHLNSSGKWAALLPTIPEGRNYLWHTPKSEGLPLFGWRTRYWSFLLKLAKNRPSWTIQAEPGPATGPFHWRSRKLSIRELCRLQTFPDTFEIIGDYRSCHRQIGNAVPPAITEILGLEIRRQFFGENVLCTSSFVPSQRAVCPSPEPVKPVPPQYRNLLSDHEDHPGTGLGPGAQRRVE